MAEPAYYFLDQPVPPTLVGAIQMIDELIQYCPSCDDFDHGFGLDFSLALPTWMETAPQVIRYILLQSDVAEGVKRGHLLGLCFVAADRMVLEQLQAEGHHALAEQIVEALRVGYPRFKLYLAEVHRLVRYWAIWGIRMSHMPDAREILAAHLVHESAEDNRNAILAHIDPNWKPTEQSASFEDDIPF